MKPIHNYFKIGSVATLTTLLAICWNGCTQSEPTPPTWQEKLESHLSSNPGGALVLEAINAHGGLEKWIDAEVIKFRWAYSMHEHGAAPVVDTVQRVDTNSMVAKHEVPDSDVTLGWDGSDAWVHPAGTKFNPPPRFWALTPFYFIGVPFVFGDLNANFELLEATIAFEGVDYQQARITFNAAAGDSPDDYYIIMIDPETKHVGGVRYIVTSKLVYPDGPSPEKLFTLENLQEFDGILLPTKHRSYAMDGDSIGEETGVAAITGYQWLERANADMKAPEGAQKL